MQAQLIPVTINGVLQEVQADQSIATLLESLNVGRDRVAVELNASIVRKRDWPQTMVRAGSHIEIVEFVGGG